MSAYEQLMAFSHTTEALGQVAGRLGWDQEAIMPEGAGPQRAEEMAAMESVLHARRIDPKVGAWLAEIDPAQLNDVARAQLRHIKKSFERTSKVPADLAAEIAKVTSRSQRIWAQARGDQDVAAFFANAERGGEPQAAGRSGAGSGWRCL